MQGGSRAQTTGEGQAGLPEARVGWTGRLAQHLRALAATVGWDPQPSAAQDAARFVPLRAARELDPLVERSHQEPVILFQHDPFCPISQSAYRELARLPIEAAVVDVARDRHLSWMVEQWTGVRHESPQVLVLRDGQVVWSASHFEITRAAVARALGGAAAGSSRERPELACGPACRRSRAAAGADRGPAGTSTETAGLAARLGSAWRSQ